MIKFKKIEIEPKGAKAEVLPLLAYLDKNVFIQVRQSLFKVL